jgi:hypothetical protein
MGHTNPSNNNNPLRGLNRTEIWTISIDPRYSGSQITGASGYIKPLRRRVQFCESFHIDTKKEYNDAGQGLMVHEERTAYMQTWATELSKPAIYIHGISMYSSCKIGRQSPYLKQKEYSTVRKGHPDESNPYL